MAVARHDVEDIDGFALPVLHVNSAIFENAIRGVTCPASKAYADRATFVVPPLKAHVWKARIVGIQVHNVTQTEQAFPRWPR